jgi:biopolymer transport protein ExbB
MDGALRAWLGFMEAGGPVLWVIFAVSTLLWALVAERYWFMLVAWPRLAGRLRGRWSARAEHRSWAARRIREALVAEGRRALEARLPELAALVALCPLLGLLGTVSGMIHVFDAIAFVGTGGSRAMAAGISRATLPTLAGMVVAIPGLWLAARLRQRARRSARALADTLT